MGSLAVIRLPHISNFTDFSVFELIDGVSLRYVTDKRELGEPDLILLPGTKNTMADMEWLIESGLESKIIRAAKDTRIIGVCGGFQILGKELHDPEHVEHGGDMRGLGLLDTSTVFQGGKTRTRIHGCIREEHNLYGLENRQLEGYEIHMGRTESAAAPLADFTTQTGERRTDGLSSGNVWGCYVHGIFDKAGAALRELCASGQELTSYIISTIAATEPLLTARQKGMQAAEDYMEQVTGQMRQRDRRQILCTTKEDLEKVSRILDEICEKGGSCIVGGQEILEVAGEALSCRRDL